ncbi:dihydropyrimidinase [Listeria sp. PSOL-1]|uniref:dihydropyrimidinase n=1 Tax=Listeria sp. PSOL-1 TaxID=1844999 RepID=UPI0013D4FA1D|nr:dihydropyrimidinase [Listeria sp. PSOL-1]
MSLLLKGGVVVSANERRALDVRIEGEKVVEMGAHLPQQDSEVENVSGLFLLPGFIDAHTHLELNNGVTTTADNFETGSKAAIAKGTTTVIDFATPEKGGTLLECLNTWNHMAKNISSCDYSYHMSIIEWHSALPDEISQMIDKGITSFKMYMAYDHLRTSDAEIYAAMKEIRKHHGMLGMHCENGDLIDSLISQFIKKGDRSPHFHPLSRPELAEAEAVNRYLTLAKFADLPVNIVHLSSALSLEVVRKFRATGQKVYVETCPHYLLLDDTLYDLPDFASSKYVCSPPLRKKANQVMLWRGIQMREIDTISTDHCSFHFQSQKTLGLSDFSKIPNGLPGVETRPELLYTTGVITGKITLERMVELLSEKIARQFGMFPQKGIIQPQSDADIVVWDPEKTGVIAAKTQLQNVDYSPYEGFETKGAAKAVYLRGKKVAEDGKIIQTKGGKFIKRGASDYSFLEE